jgi:hypothetical protein
MSDLNAPGLPTVATLAAEAIPARAPCTSTQRCHTTHPEGRVGSKHQGNGRQQSNATPTHAPPHRSPQHGGHAPKGGGDRQGGRGCNTDRADPLTVCLGIDDEGDCSNHVDSPR